MTTEHVLSRGTYHHPQRSDFLSAREFVFLSCEGRKRVLVRFRNECEYPLHAIEFVLISRDAAQQRLNQTVVRYSNLCIAPGRTFVTPTAIAIPDACVDIEVRVRCVRSECFVFSIQGDTQVVRYDRRSAVSMPDAAHRPPISLTAQTMTSATRRRGALATFLATLAILAIAALALFVPLDGILGIPL